MTRSSADRGFGFRASGIARILTTADADEVLRALLLLGIDPQSEDAFTSLTESVVAIWAKPVGAVLAMFDTIVATIDEIVEIADGRITPLPGHDPAWETVLSAGTLAKRNTLATRGELEELQISFQRRMDEANAEYPQFVWPATPGVFEEA